MKIVAREGTKRAKFVAVRRKVVQGSPNQQHPQTTNPEQVGPNGCALKGGPSLPPSPRVFRVQLWSLGSGKVGLSVLEVWA